MEIGAKFKVTIKVEEKDTAMAHGSGTLAVLATPRMIALMEESAYKCIDKYLTSKGCIKMKQPRKSDNTKYTGKEFYKIFNGVCVANIGGNHVVCIKNGKVHDTWDSTDGCIGNYWVKE